MVEIHILIDIYNIFFREPTPFEHTSAVKIQKNWKAFYVRKITQARTQGKALTPPSLMKTTPVPSDFVS